MKRRGPNDPCWCGSGKKYKKCHMHRDVMADLQGGGTAAADSSLRAGTVGPARDLPPGIPRPEYAQNGRPARKTAGTLYKDADQLERMRASCALARQVLDTTKAAVAVGVTTDELDRVAHEACVAAGAYPSPLNYCGYPKSICTSVNEVICHGIPDDRPLADGDIVNIDITVFRDGMHGDCSETVAVGSIDASCTRLLAVTRAALDAGVAAVRPGGRVCDIGRAIEETVAPFGYGVVRDFVGHGIGEVFHMDPQVPHYYDRKATFDLRPGMTFTIEPMITIGDFRHRLWPDNWTAVTRDGERSAQFEHTVLVTDSGVAVLTAGNDDG
ncbi:MAG: type I methionyl aminopeptidase [Planctomycetota bacterium]